jgi:hypothetical protein
MNKFRGFHGDGFGDRLDSKQRTLPEGWRYKMIGYMALVAGIIGAGIAYFGKGSAISNLNVGVGLPMLFVPYLLVPRVKTQRVWQGIAAGVLSGIIALGLLLLFATAKFLPAINEAGLVFLEYAVGAGVTSWLSSFVAQWTDKYTSKRVAEKNAKRLQELAAQRKDRYRIDKNGKIVRVHRKKRKKR